MNSTSSSSHISVPRAFFIKLGAGARWADDSLRDGLLRFGWSTIPLTDIHAGDWSRIEERLRAGTPNRGAATRDLNGLRDLVLSTGEDVWITFHRSKLWWGRLDDTPIEEDNVSKFRRLSAPWSDKARDGTPLIATQVPGVLSAVQGYRGTICSVRAPSVLERLLNAEPSPAHKQVSEAQVALGAAVSHALKELHWKDFETLVDLVFRQAGWRRTSLLGETMKYADLELEEPVTRERYQVQVKSRADLGEFRRYAQEFAPAEFRRLYFVVHSPTRDLERYVSASDNGAVVLLRPSELAAMVVSAGLTDWLLDRIR